MILFSRTFVRKRVIKLAITKPAHQELSQWASFVSL
jgi:hypothetical protein